MAQALSKPAPTIADFDRRPMRIIRLLQLSLLSGGAFAAWKIQWKPLLKKFFTGPGSLSRIFMLLFAMLNWKNMPGVWTYRVWGSIVYHCLTNKSPILGPRALFRPMISESRAPLMEIDYNFHKNNATYFSDLDHARTNLVSHLLRPGFRNLTHNLKSNLVSDPITGRPRKGDLLIGLGGVHCSFHKEILPYRGYETWTRILAWDRKWLYMVTHFVPKGLVRPSEYLDDRFDKLKTRKGGNNNNSASSSSSRTWQKKIYATAISKYVFKLGRWTVHPTYLLEASELLPDRPEGGWRSGPNEVGDEAEDLSEVVHDGTWDWKMVEKRRRDGMEFAQQFANLDNLEAWFDGADGGDGSAIGRFGL